MNTELRERYLATVCEHLEAVRDGARLLDLGLALADAVAGAAREKLDALGL